MALAKTFRLPADQPLLNIVSYGKGGPRAGTRLAPAEVEHIRRTVQRVPEVMVKVLSRASNDLEAAGKHIDYLSRRGELALETDDATRLDHPSGEALLADWDLDVDDVRRQSTLSVANGREPAKLIHKLMFSMPPGTPPEKVLKAVRNLAREEFWGQHRYTLVLHTDEAHPHVHLVLKAMSEQGVRLNIKKATLRHWRSGFASHLRLLGVAANATERAVRGESRKPKKDGIYRASLRGDSSYIRGSVEAIAEGVLRKKVQVGRGADTLAETRSRVLEGWRGAARLLSQQKENELTGEVEKFVRHMKPAWTEQQWMAHDLQTYLRGRDTVQDRSH